LHVFYVRNGDEWRLARITWMIISMIIRRLFEGVANHLDSGSVATCRGNGRTRHSEKNTPKNPESTFEYVGRSCCISSAETVQLLTFLEKIAGNGQSELFCVPVERATVADWSDCMPLCVHVFGENDAKTPSASAAQLPARWL